MAHNVFILMYLFLWDVYVRGRHYVFFISFIACATLMIDLYYEVIHDMSFIFLFCEIKNLFWFYLYFPHMRFCVC